MRRRYIVTSRVELMQVAGFCHEVILRSVWGEIATPSRILAVVVMCFGGGLAGWQRWARSGSLMVGAGDEA